MLGAKGLEVLDGPGPEVEDVVAGEGRPLLDHGHAHAQERGLDGGPEADGAGADHDHPRVGGQHVLPEHGQLRLLLQQLEQRSALERLDILLKMRIT